MALGNDRQNRRTFLKLAGTAGIAGLAGCSGGDGGDGGDGGGDGGSDGGDGGDGGTTTTTTSGDGGGGSSTLTVGYLSWLSGPFASAGVQHQRAAQIALDSRDSMVNGIEIEWIAKDTKATPETAISRARELVQQEDADILTGCTTSASGKALQQFASSQGIPFVHGATQTPDVTGPECKEMAFRYPTNIVHQQVPLAEGLARMTPEDATRVAGINPDYVYGRQSWEVFKEQFQERRPDVEFVSEQFPAFGKGEYSKETQATIDAEPDIVHSVLYSGDMISFIKQAQQFDFFNEIGTFGAVSLDLVAATLGDEMVRAIAATPTHWNWQDNPRMQNLTEEYVDRHGTIPDGFFAGYGHANVDFIAAVLEETGSTEQSAMLDAMVDLEFQSAIPTTKIRPGDHQGFHDSYFVGEYVPIEDDPLPDQTLYGMEEIEFIDEQIVRDADPDNCEAF